MPSLAVHSTDAVFSSSFHTSNCMHNESRGMKPVKMPVHWMGMGGQVGRTRSACTWHN